MSKDETISQDDLADAIAQSLNTRDMTGVIRDLAGLEKWFKGFEGPDKRWSRSRKSKPKLKETSNTGRSAKARNQLAKFEKALVVARNAALDMEYPAFSQMDASKYDIVKWLDGFASDCVAAHEKVLAGEGRHLPAEKKRFIAKATQIYRARTGKEPRGEGWRDFRDLAWNYVTGEEPSSDEFTRAEQAVLEEKGRWPNPRGN